MLEAGGTKKTMESLQQQVGHRIGALPVDNQTDLQPKYPELMASVMEGQPYAHPMNNESGKQSVETRPMDESLPTTTAENSTPKLSVSTERAPEPDISVPLVSNASVEGTLDSSLEKKQVRGGKVVACNRKFIPPKKDRLEPLKMDMSKPIVMPVTSAQLSLQCVECHIIFSDHKTKERHIKQSHPAEYEQCMLGDALFFCYVCDRQFTKSTDLMTHQRSHTEKQPFKCPICGEAFSRSSELTGHKKSHFGQHGIPCLDCGKLCKTLTLLKYHRRTHTGEKPYSCKECGKQFIMLKSLQKHLKAHVEGSDINGGIKAQTSSNELKKSVGKFPCSLCKSIFKTPRTRLNHMKHKHSPCPTGPSGTTSAGQQLKLGMPRISPAPMFYQNNSHPNVLHLEHIGPLQQVGNIDTEQIRKLIESLGNVHKVNQVVVLGQVPPRPHPLPLDLQQIQTIGDPLQLHLTQPQIDLVEVKQPEPKQINKQPEQEDLKRPEQIMTKSIELAQPAMDCNDMEITITLEPVVLEDQLENPSLSNAHAHIVPERHIVGTIIEPQKTETHEEDRRSEQLPELTETGGQGISHNQTVELEQAPEQTVALEVSSLVPTLECKQASTVKQGQVTAPCLLPAIELEQTSGRQLLIGQEERTEQPFGRLLIDEEERIDQTSGQLLMDEEERMDLSSGRLLIDETDRTEKTSGELVTDEEERIEKMTGRLLIDETDRTEKTSGQLVTDEEERMEKTSGRLLIDETDRTEKTSGQVVTNEEERMEKTSGRLLIDEEETMKRASGQPLLDSKEIMSVPALTPTVELETPSHTDQLVELPVASLVQTVICTKSPPEQSQTNQEQETDSHIVEEKVHSTLETDSTHTSHDICAHDLLEKPLQEGGEREELNRLGKSQRHSHATSTEKNTDGTGGNMLQIKPVTQLPVNVMSVQEFVKLRKRKQSNLHLQFGAMQYAEKPTKRPKKASLEVSFSPKKKEKKSKTTKPSPPGKLPQKEKLTEDEVEKCVPTPQKKGAKKQKASKKGKNPKKQVDVLSKSEVKSPILHESQEQHLQEKARKTIIKTQNGFISEGLEQLSGHEVVSTPKPKKKKQQLEQLSSQEVISSPMPKKKKQQLEQLSGQEVISSPKPKKKKQQLKQLSGQEVISSPNPKNKKQENVMNNTQPDQTIAGKLPRKGRKRNPKQNMETSAPSAEMPSQQITQESLLLLKGHKQPQLKVYKIDVAQAPEEPQETLVQSQTNGMPCKENTSRQRKKGPKSKPLKIITVGVKKKVGRPKKNQKAINLLPPPAPIPVSSDMHPTKPKTTRKRKLNTNLETEGVISSHSCQVLECQDCGEKFTELSSLQGHKAAMHAMESPGLTYANGNIFEGITRSDLCQPPKVCVETENVMNQNTIDVPSGWGMEVQVEEMALGHKDERVASLASLAAAGITGNGCEESLHQSPSVQSALLLPGCTSGHQVPIEEDIKEELLLDVDLVTVGEQHERMNHNNGSEMIFTDTLVHESFSGNVESTLSPCAQVQTERETMTGTGSCSQTCSTSTEQPEIKREEEEVLVQRKDEEKGVWRRNITTRDRRKGAGRGRRGVMRRRSSDGDGMRETESQTGECQAVSQKNSLTDDSDVKDELEANGSQICVSAASLQPNKGPTSETHREVAHATSAPTFSSSREEPPDQVVFELESVTTSVEEMLKSEEDGLGMEVGEQHSRETGQSPGIILERFFTSRQREGGDQDPSIRHTSQSTQSLMKENSFTLNDPHATQNYRPTKWIVEQVDTYNAPGLQTEVGNQTGADTVVHGARQCIFYPVKEEEKEVPLEPSQSHPWVSAQAAPEDNTLGQPTEHPTRLYERNSTDEEYEVNRARGAGINAFGNAGEDFLDSEQQNACELQEFLLQSSDDEDSDVLEFSDPKPDPEILVMAKFQDGQIHDRPHSNELPNNSSTCWSQAHPRPRDESSCAKKVDEQKVVLSPIDYFLKYLGWDTWADIANCTNKLSNLSDPVTAKEVSQFVGIHIAMGTLKFPSPRLYWQEFTRVPLIADAMSASRFTQLSHKLKLASPAMDSNTDVRHDHGSRDRTGPREQLNTYGEDNDQEIPTTSIANTMRTESKSTGYNHTSHSQMHAHSAKRMIPGNATTLRMCSEQQHCQKIDPIWRVRPILDRVRAGCLMLGREGDHGVDQYPVHLTARPVNNTNQPSLHSTVLLDSAGMILHLDLSADLSEKEATVEKMVPRNGMVFLCKQELSTPAMLERLLVAGVRGAGKVGGARGEIGDEYVSSDGKLMLRRSHSGFILSTIEKGQYNMATLINKFEKAQRAAHFHRDLCNLYRIPPSATAPSCWPQVVLWYLIDVALVNSWLHYRQDCDPKPLNLMTFRLEVSKALIFSSGSDTQDSVSPRPSTQSSHTPDVPANPGPMPESPLPDAAVRYDGSSHWPEQVGEGEGGRCRFGRCERMSRVRCLKCCVFLCISRNHNCFLNFHNCGSV